MRSSQKTGICGLCLLAVASVALVASPAMATVKWTGDGDWTDDAGNWDPYAPVASESVVLKRGILGFNDETATILNMAMGEDNTADTSTFNMTGGSLTITGGDGATYYGYSVAGGAIDTWNVSGGTVLLTGTPGGLNMMYGGVLNNNGDATSILNMNAPGGTMIVNGTLNFGAGGQGASWTAEINLAAGTLQATSIVPGSATQSFDMTGGTLILNGEYPNTNQLPSFATANGSGQGDFLFNYDGGADQTTITVVPEPSTCVLVVIGALCLGLVRRRKRS